MGNEQHDTGRSDCRRHLPSIHRVKTGTGLEDILRWTYYAEGGPKLLDLVIDNVAAILEESNGSQEPNGLTVMSQGACIPLHRVLALLHKYKQAHAIGNHRASEPSRDDTP